MHGLRNGEGVLELQAGVSDQSLRGVFVGGVCVTGALAREEGTGSEYEDIDGANDCDGVAV